jgi:hypothetical protein
VIRGLRILVLGGLLALATVNFFAGLLALFPGLFEVALQRAVDPARSGVSGDVALLELLVTPYGAFALALLLGAALQYAAFGGLGALLRDGLRGALLIAGVALLTAGLEVWGVYFKGRVDVVNALGFLLALSLLLLAPTGARR